MGGVNSLQSAGGDDGMYCRRVGVLLAEGDGILC